MKTVAVSRHPSRSAVALRFGSVAAVVALVAALLSQLAIWCTPPADYPGIRFPPTFAPGTLALLLGSAALSRAIGFVRREKQPAFRRSLWTALGTGTIFVALQGASLNWLVQRQSPDDVATGAAAFVMIAAALHAMHFVVAILFLAYVVVNANSDRYDHEYYFGVTVCAWFWHALGILWIAVLVVIAIASSATNDGPHPTLDVQPAASR